MTWCGVNVIDTWNMTVATLPGTRSGRFVVDLPARPYMAVRLRRVDAGSSAAAGDAA
jgi:hypothetical protein